MTAIINLTERLGMANQLQKYIEDYLSRNEMSQRALASQMGVSNTTVGDVLKKTKPATPSVDFLVRLAKATKADIREIIVLISPDDVIHDSTSEAAALATRIAKLPDEDRKLIDRFISGVKAKLKESDEDI